jgi:hypothetical protein
VNNNKSTSTNACLAQDFKTHQNIIFDMSSNKKAYFINSEGPAVDSVKKAFGWLFSYDSGYIAAAGNNNLNGVISDVIDQQAVKSLIATNSLRFSGKEFFLITERKPIYLGKGLPLLAFYPSAKFLDKLQSIPNISAMLVVPWTKQEIEPWIRTVNATELGAPARPVQELIPNKVVVQALKSLSMSVNKSTGIIHPSDKGTAIQTFTILRDAGEKFSPEDVKAWLIREGGWNATYAQDVADLAQKVLDYRKLQGGHPHWRPDILEIWRDDASKDKCVNP